MLSRSSVFRSVRQSFVSKLYFITRSAGIKGIDVNPVHGAGFTPLMMAADHGHPDCVQHLLQNC